MFYSHKNDESQQYNNNHKKKNWIIKYYEQV